MVILLGLCGSLPAQAGLFSIRSKDRQEYVHAREIYDSGDYESAVTELSNYIYKTKNIKRREARAYRLLGISYEKLNKPEKALEVYQEALEFHNDHIPLLLTAASLYQRTQLTGRSIELYDRVLQLDPTNETALAGQAENYITMGFYSKARQYYDLLFSINPQAPAVHRARYAYTFFKQRDFKNAFINITMAKMEAPSNISYWLLSAQAYKGLGRPADALAELNAAIWLAPEQTELRLIKSMWLYQQGNKQASIQELNEILTFQPTNEVALFMMYMNLKDKSAAKAKQYLQKITALETDSFAHKVAQKILAQK